MDHDRDEDPLCRISFSLSTEAIWYSSETRVDEQEWKTDDFVNGRLGTYKAADESIASLNIVILEGHPRYTGISATKEHFQHFVKLFEIPQAYLDAILSNNGQLAHFRTYSTNGPDEDCSRICVLMQTPHSVIRSFSLALSISLQTGSAAGIIIVEAKNDSTQIIRALRNHANLIKSCPLHVLATLCQALDRRNEDCREDLDASLVQVERRIGATNYYSSSSDGTNKIFNANVPYESLVRDLHALNTSLIWLNCTINFELEALKFTECMMQVFQQELESSSLPILSKSTREKVLQLVRYLESAGQMRQYQRSGLQQRAETQIQILYSRISQRDSLLNLEIAIESKRIATFTREDSIAINTISVVTLFFLPAMLVATVCSSGIFEFQQDAVIISRKWWIFLVVTVGLTIVILGIWGFYLIWKRRSDPIRTNTADGRKSFSDSNDRLKTR